MSTDVSSPITVISQRPVACGTETWNLELPSVSARHLCRWAFFGSDLLSPFWMVCWRWNIGKTWIDPCLQDAVTYGNHELHQSSIPSSFPVCQSAGNICGQACNSIVSQEHTLARPPCEAWPSIGHFAAQPCPPAPTAVTTPLWWKWYCISGLAEWAPRCPHSMVGWQTKSFKQNFDAQKGDTCSVAHELGYKHLQV